MGSEVAAAETMFGGAVIIEDGETVSDVRVDPGGWPTCDRNGTLKFLQPLRSRMHLTCEVVGGATHDLELDDDATYGDVLDAVGLSSHEASVLVDGSPVPEDRSVDSESVRVLRLIKGG